MNKLNVQQSKIDEDENEVLRKLTKFEINELIDKYEKLDKTKNKIILDTIEMIKLKIKLKDKSPETKIFIDFLKLAISSSLINHPKTNRVIKILKIEYDFYNEMNISDKDSRDEISHKYNTKLEKLITKYKLKDEGKLKKK